MIKEYSILDAFRALDDIEDEQPKKRIKRARSITEGKTFDLGNDQQMEEAKTFIKDSEKKDDTEIQVIDVDADSLDHIKNNEEYIGQYILQCNACKTLRYVAEDKLQVSENDPSIYNADDECPHCHALNSGYALIGQVGRVEKAEPELENDEASEDELTFEKEEDEVVEPAENEESEFEPVEEPEENPDEVPEDDTADMESTFGNEINSDETAEDDTEEKDEEEDEEAKLAAQLGAALKADEEEEEKKKKAKKESFSREQAIKFLEEKGINCKEGLESTYAKMLLEEDVDESELNEDFYYQETLDSIVWRVNEYRKSLKDNECWINEDFDPKSPEEELAKTIVLANNLKVDNMNKAGTPEYFILDELVNGPVSEELYNDYVYALDEDVKKAFADLTGFDIAKADFEYDRYISKRAEEEGEAPDLYDSVNEDGDEALYYVDYVSDYGDDNAAYYPKLDFDVVEKGHDQMSEIVMRVTGTKEELGRFVKEHNERINWLDQEGGYFDDEDVSDWLIDPNEIKPVEEIKEEKIPESVTNEAENEFDEVAKEAEDLVIDEDLDEAKKEEEELPADPEAVKTEVHELINNLVADEIAAIEQHEEAKAAIADTHIEHKDEIIDVIDHIEDEEKEHIDELIDAASEIPFEKEDKEEEEEKKEEEIPEEEPQPEVVEEPVIEEPAEVEPEVPAEEAEEAVEKEVDEKTINEAINAKLKETGNEDAIFETLSGSFDDNSMLIEGNIISGDLKVPTKFRFELLENNQYKVTNTLSDEEYIINL